MSVHKDAAAKRPKRKKPKNGPVTVTELIPEAKLVVAAFQTRLPGSHVQIINERTAIVWNHGNHP